MTIIFFLLKYLYRELYPRVLECILQTESSEMILSNKDEILETLNIVATDAGNKHYHVKKSCTCHLNFQNAKFQKGKEVVFLLAIYSFSTTTLRLSN